MTRQMIGSKTGRWLIVAAIAGLAAIVPAEQGNEKQSIPLIVMSDVPVLDAIKNLARQAGINYIVDPRLAAEPSVLINLRWENLTANAALKRVLEERGIQLIESPKSGVARITRSKEPPRPTGIDLTGETNDTKNVIPLIVMDEVPLADAISNLARQGQLNVKLDSRLTSAEPPPTVSVRWEGVTARQALVSLMENYDLVAAKNDDTSLTIKSVAEKERSGAK